MKFKKPSKSALTESAALVGGLAVGGALSRGVVALLHKNEVKATPQDQKKYDNAGLIKRGLIAAIAYYVGSGIAGNDNVSTLGKGALLGMSVVQLLEIVKHLAAKTNAGQNLAVSARKTDQFIANTIGLGCACDAPAPWSAPAMPLNSPAMVLQQPSFNSFDQDILEGSYQASA